ncbi:MAG: rhomboid family intramembrane serine protease [Nonlabens sp.]
MMNFDIATIVIIAGTCIVSFKAFNDLAFKAKYLFNIAGIQRGEQYRFITSGFLHADERHLLFNMVTFFFFAGTVIDRLSSLNMIVIYLASMIGGSLLSFVFHKDEYHYSALGASGAVSGIIYSAILLDPDMRIYFGIPGYIFGLGYLVYSIYGMKVKRDNIGHDAHFGGAMTGYVITLFYDFDIVYEQPLIVGTLLIPIIALFVMMKLGKI